ncbi:MAG: anaerobic ribonucleoside-triphosphate reductase activating protein [bacterium]
MQIKGFQETTLMDWEGVVASIIFVGGCNFRCIYCHNYNIAFNSNSSESIPEDDVLQRLRELKNWIEGVIISGGEPTIYGDKLEAFLCRLKQEGFKTKIYTNGSNPSLLSRLIEKKVVDAVSMDIKHILLYYNNVVNAMNADITRFVEDSVAILKNSSDLQVKFRLTVVKGVHTEEDILQIKQFVSPKPLVLQNVSTEHIPEYFKERIRPFSAAEFEALQKSIL